MSDTGESTSSLDWAIVDTKGDIPDDDATSTASSVEVVDDDDEEDSFDRHGTPLAGSPNNNMPKFVLRVPMRQSTRYVSDTDDEHSDISSSILTSEASIVSVPESLPISSVPSTSLSEQSTAGQAYRQTSSNARISKEDLEDLCNKIDTIKQALEPTKNVEDVTSDDLFGDGNPNRSEPSHEPVNNLPREVENLYPSECLDGDTSLQSSISSSYSFLARDAATEARTDPGLMDLYIENGGTEQLLVEQLLADQEPATQEHVTREPVIEEQEVEPENMNDLLQVEQGQNYLQTFVSYVIDYRDVISWLIGFGSYTGLVVATVIFFSSPGPVPSCQPIIPESVPVNHLSPVPQFCHPGDGCYTDSNEEKLKYQMKKLAKSEDTIELENQIKDNDDYIAKLTKREEQQDDKIHAMKKAIKNLEYELKEARNEKERLEDRREVAIDGWKKEWQDGLAREADLLKHKVDVETELEEVRDHLSETKMEFDSARDECNTDIDDIKVRCKTDLDNVRGQHQTELDQVKSQCWHELDNLRIQYQTDLDKVKGQCQHDHDNLRIQYQTDLDNLKHQHQFEINRFQRQSEDEVKKAQKSCERRPVEDSTTDRSDGGQTNEEGDLGRKWFHDHAQTEDDESNYNNENEFPKDIPYTRWADTVLEMMNNTKHQIDQTWAKVKNMSESLWQDHEPTIMSLHQTFKEEFVQLNKFQQRVTQKLRKWFGRKQGGAAKTKRRKYEKDDNTRSQDDRQNSGLPATVEERIVALSYRVDHFSARTFRKTFKKKKDVLESIQAEFKDIDATKKIPRTYEEKIKWKGSILTDQHLKWLRCQQQWWEDFIRVPDKCYAELCCWQVKIGDGNVKACKKFKRRHGMVEDHCFLELPKESVDTDNEELEIPSPCTDPQVKDTDNEEEDNWFLEIGEDRDYKRTEPDDWFFRRQSQSNQVKIHKTAGKYDNLNDNDYLDDDIDDIYDEEDGDTEEINSCYPDRCDFP